MYSRAAVGQKACQRSCDSDGTRFRCSPNRQLATRDAGGNRTHFRPGCSRSPRRPAPASFEHPGSELNRDPGLRRARCCPLHHQDVGQSRRLDLHQYQPTYEAGAFLDRATSAKQERKDSNPVARCWKPFALPGARSCPRANQGVRGELNPPPRPSQGRMLAVYTTNTIVGPQAPAEGAGVEPARPYKGSAGFQPAPVAKSGGPSEVVSSPGWTRTTDLPHVTGTSCH